MRFAGPIPAQHVTVPSGNAGVRATMALMVQLVKRYKAHPLIRELARYLVQEAPERNVDAELAELQHYVRDNIRYTLDVAGVETLQTPVVTLGYIEERPPTFRFAPGSGGPVMIDAGQWRPGGAASGDCDDKSILLASLMQAIGIPGAFCAIKVKGEPDYSHVLVEARVRRRNKVGYVPLETILPGVEPGWMPPDTSCFMLAHFG